jgi:hypothetical protein
MRVRIRGRLRVAGLVVALIGVGGCASYTAPKSDVVSWDALRDSRFLEGASQQTGEFTGTLLSLPCDLKRGPNSRIQCEEGTRRPALLIPGDTTLHPLLATEASVRDKLISPALVGKRVLVDGILFPELKAILVSGIQLAQ